jgi:UDPglucose 6-dehydrogenase
MELNQVNPCVIGLGKLGLPLAAVIADAGFYTYGLDKSRSLVEDLRNNKFKSPEPNLNSLIDRNIDKLNFVNDFSEVSKCNIFFLIVPTPSMSNGQFEDKYLKMAILDILESFSGLSGQKTIVIVSTVMPKTCTEVFLPLIRSWEKVNGNFLRINLLYAPEFIALGTVIYNLKNPDMTLIGCESPEHSEIFLQIMARITTEKPETQILSLTEAEVVKLMVNCFVTMKISFANFIGEISSVLPGTDKYRISKALGMDSRIGGKYLRPGLGFAGPCFPRDNKALISFASENGLKASLGLATEEINLRQPENILKSLKLNYPNAKSIGIAGITYKPNSKVIEESQTLMIARLLKSHKMDVKLYDPLLEASDLHEFTMCESVGDISSVDVLLVSKEFEFLVSEINDSGIEILIV